MMNFTTTSQAIATLGEERALRLIHSALKAQDRSKAQGAKDREILRMVKAGEYGGTKVDLTTK